MQVIDLTTSKDPARVLRLACEPGINQPGTWLIYHHGDYADQIGTTAVGRAACELSNQGSVHLVQKLLHTEPRQYAYVAVVTGS